MRFFTLSYLLTLLFYPISGLFFHLKSRGTSLPPADYLRDINRAYRSLLRNKFRFQVWTAGNAPQEKQQVHVITGELGNLTGNRKGYTGEGQAANYKANRSQNRQQVA
jgi:hypothetical protein